MVSYVMIIGAHLVCLSVNPWKHHLLRPFLMVIFSHTQMMTMQIWSRKGWIFMRFWGSLFCPLLGQTLRIIFSHAMTSLAVFGADLEQQRSPLLAGFW